MPNYFQISPVDFANLFYVFTIHVYTLKKVAQPSGSHVFQWIKLIWAILVEDHPRTIVHYFQIGPVAFDKIFKVLPFGCHCNQNSAWNGNL